MASAWKVLPNGDIEGISPTELREIAVFVTREQYIALVDLVTAVDSVRRQGYPLPESIKLAFEKVTDVFPPQ